MRIFKYWVQHSKELIIENKKQPSKVYGGSNISEDDAIKDAENKLINAQKIIDGELAPDDNYEADIVEEIIEIIDENNIITRNRYGALVLNSKKLMFIDIDEYTKSVVDIFFRANYTTKQLMLKKIEKIASMSKYSELGFRVYETFKGYRVMVCSKDFNPRSNESSFILNEFNSDYLYRMLCIKQNCYRARLTPKPYRIKQKKTKVIYPDRTEEQQENLLNWIKEYNQKSELFSTCHLVKEFGKINAHKVIEYHDNIAGVKKRNPLA